MSNMAIIVAAAFGLALPVQFNLPAGCTLGDQLTCSFDGVNLLCHCSDYHRGTMDPMKKETEKEAAPSGKVGAGLDAGRQGGVDEQVSR